MKIQALRALIAIVRLRRSTIRVAARATFPSHDVSNARIGDRHAQDENRMSDIETAIRAFSHQNLERSAIKVPQSAALRSF